MLVRRGEDDLAVIEEDVFRLIAAPAVEHAGRFVAMDGDEDFGQRRLRQIRLIDAARKAMFVVTTHSPRLRPARYDDCFFSSSAGLSSVLPFEAVAEVGDAFAEALAELRELPAPKRTTTMIRISSSSGNPSPNMKPPNDRLPLDADEV